ncbi:hypothetical protein ABZ929_28755 [Streptomyces physcomitrii]|uniref:hypothetical protein n=1 Tax=Streptomyces physcomitrii TaxID=2724184 RepID=UPI003439E8D6
MKRRTLPAVAAFASAAALLLSACGSDDESPKEKDPIAGAETGEPGGKQSSSPSSGSADNAKRPTFTLPKDVENNYAGWKAGEATKDAVLTDASRRIDATSYAITQSDADDPVLGFYYKGDALVEAAQWVKQFVDTKKSMTGETRFFNPKVDVYSPGKATLTYCAFEGKAYVKDIKTGKPDKTPVTEKSYLLYSTRLEKSETGVWKTSVLNSERGNKSCVQ